MPWVKSSVAVAARRPSDPDISELSLTSFRSIRSPQAFLPASVIPHPRDFDDACPLGLIRRRGFRRAEIPPVGAADDPCRMDCTPGTASPPRRSRTHARRPTEDRRASRTPTRCRGSRELSLPCWHFPAVEYGRVASQRCGVSAVGAIRRGCQRAAFESPPSPHQPSFCALRSYLK